MIVISTKTAREPTQHKKIKTKRVQRTKQTNGLFNFKLWSIVVLFKSHAEGAHDGTTF